MGCTGSRADLTYDDINIDNPEPSPSEAQLCAGNVDTLARANEVLERLRSYKGCAEYIKVAVRTPSAENDIAAWNQVVPAVIMLKDLFDYYASVKACLIGSISFICRDDPFISLPENLATAKQIVQMFDFIIRFDELKMGKASIQNDFSFYRRTMNRMRQNNHLLNNNNNPDAPRVDIQAPPVNDETANKMSLFFAYPNPFTKALIDEFMKNLAIGTKENVCRTFAIVANACRAMAERGNDREEIFRLFRAMVAAILFYDACFPQGVFVKKSDVDMYSCVMSLKRYDADTIDLLNTIRYGCHSFNSDSTPRKIIDAMQ